MRKGLFILALTLARLIFFASPALAQQLNCPLMQAPELRGFKLGMSKKDALIKLPQLEARTGDFGLDEITVAFTTIAKDDIQKMFDGFYFVREGFFSGFENVRSVSLKFFDDTLVSVSIEYDSTKVKWKRVDEFIAAINPPLELPDSWQKNNSSVLDTSRILICLGFLGFAEQETGYPDDKFSLRFENSAYKHWVDRRKREREENQRREEEKRRREFKP